MRVISGTARGLKLKSLDGLDTRPTLDRVKEALFSMLTPYIYDACVLDLFAGSGALGIEALSRGSKSVSFVDSSPLAMDVVRENVEKANLSSKASFHTKKSEDYLKSSSEKFDLVFLDPPYNGNLYYASLSLLSNNGLLFEDGVVCLEWDSELSRPDIPPCYEILKERRYGRVMVTLLTLKKGC